jgi:hypothetical protein
MARSSGVTFAQVEKMAVTLPGVVARSSYGTPGLYVAKKFMARLREPDVLVLTPVEDDEQRFLMETQPEVFFKTPHYVGHPSVLIRLSKADRAQMRDLIGQSWRRLAPKKLLDEYDGAAKNSRPGAASASPKRSTRARTARRRSR